MLSCLVPPRFGQEDKITSMPSSPAFSMQFPSLASSLHHHSQNKSDDSSSASSAATAATTAQQGGHAVGIGDYIVKCPQCHQRMSVQALHEHIETEHGNDKLTFENHPNGYHIDRDIEYISAQQHSKQNHNNNNLNNNNNNSNSNNKNNNNLKIHSINNNCHSSSSSSSSMPSSMIPSGGGGGRTSPIQTSHSPLAGTSAQRTTPPTDLCSQYHHQAMAMALAVGMSTSATAASNGYDASAAAIAAAEAMVMAGSRSTTSPLNGHNVGSGGSVVGAGGNCGASTASSSSSSSSLSLGLSSSAAGPYQCSQCSVAFPNRDLLEKHELMHSPNSTGVNQSCKICHKAFANVYRLQRHMISHDESALLRKFKCTQCDKAFKFKHHLKEHVRIHSGEKPFGCDNCGKRFSHSGSFSSHMTSKKCISMGLKLNNNRALLKNLEKSGVLGGSPNGKRSGPPQPPPGANPLSYFPHGLTGNTDGPANPPNGSNSFYPMLPKYSDYGAMNAALLATFQNPFYNMAALNPNIHPYSIHRLLELTAAGNQRLQSDPEDLIEEVTEDVADEPKLVMDLDDCEKDAEADDENARTYNRSDDEDDGDSRNSNSSTPPKQNYDDSNAEDAKTQRVESPSPTPVDRPQSPEIKVEEEDEEEENNTGEEVEPEEDHKPVNDLRCSRCDKTFNHPTELVQHEKVLCGLIKHEMEQQHQQQMQQHFRSNESETGNSSYFHSGSEEDIEDRESKNGSEGGERKVRVRTAITEEQQLVLKQHYSINARPSRDEFRVIANRLSLDARVVQVWFQNNRSRERKMNNNFNGINKAYAPIIPEPIQANSPPSPVESMKVSNGEDQPLDLSLKKEKPSNQQPAHSPLYGSVPMQVDANEAINLSRKLSPSPTPYKQSLYYSASVPSQRPTDIPAPHQHIRQTPSPNEATPPTPRYPTAANPYMMPTAAGPRAMVPMECLFQMTPEYARSHIMGSIKMGTGSDRGTSLSPGSEKRSWRDDESRISHEDDYASAAAAAAAAAVSSLMPPQQKRPKIETHGHAGDPDLPFVCDQCDKAFAKQSSLARHKYEHSGQRPYKCVDCPKAFKHKHHLTEHKRLHSGEKPFQCSKCLKRFSHSGSYSQHMNHRYSYCKPYRE